MGLLSKRARQIEAALGRAGGGGRGKLRSRALGPAASVAKVRLPGRRFTQRPPRAGAAAAASPAAAAAAAAGAFTSIVRAGLGPWAPPPRESPCSRSASAGPGLETLSVREPRRGDREGGGGGVGRQERHGRPGAEGSFPSRKGQAATPTRRLRCRGAWNK